MPEKIFNIARGENTDHTVLHMNIKQNTIILHNFRSNIRCEFRRNMEHELNHLWGNLFKYHVYEDRYILLRSQCYGNVEKLKQFSKKNDSYNYTDYVIISPMTHYPLSVRTELYAGNLLIEYSKKLRGEENKLAELEELIKQ